MPGMRSRPGWATPAAAWPSTCPGSAMRRTATGSPWPIWPPRSSRSFAASGRRRGHWPGTAWVPKSRPPSHAVPRMGPRVWAACAASCCWPAHRPRRSRWRTSNAIRCSAGSRGDAARSRTEAETFIAQNVSARLSPPAHELAAGDLLRANPVAWRAWLTTGSREDWSDRIGVLRTPALILAGADDTTLGLAAQRSLNAPHYAAVRVESVANAKHLLPLERPDQVAALIAEHLA